MFSQLFSGISIVQPLEPKHRTITVAEPHILPVGVAVPPACHERPIAGAHFPIDSDELGAVAIVATVH
jgi:hypothetical protein